MPTPPLLTHNNREFVDFEKSNEVDQRAETFATVEEFLGRYADPKVARPIKTLLIANNGMAAFKCVMSIRRWAQETFKDDRLFKFINLTTEQEIASNPEYLKMIDNFVFSQSGGNESNYANVDEILKHATGNNVDAVWAGWGHASENPDLPNRLKANNILFMGPPGPAMFTLGDKIASTILAQSARVPVVPWSGSDLYLPKEECENGRCDIEVSNELRMAACVNDHEEAIRIMKEKNIPYPVMIKASEGGGGKGIRQVRCEAEFEVNFRRVQAEIPGGHIFLMHCLEGARHIEVQLLGDLYGQVIALRTRDCSVQRRCQKIIEEAPAIAAPLAVQRSMEADAVRLAKMVGYVSAGTVEYLYLPSTNEYFFLELNPRLQVEHPLSEMLTNVNLPAAQLQIAMGVPLHCISEVRLYCGKSRYGTDKIPFDELHMSSDKHIVSVRITSEDPEENFRPASGEITNLNFRSTQFVWGYFSHVGAGSLHEYADSQFGHLFASGSTRHAAISNMLNALQELQLQSKFPVTVPYLISLFKDSDFEQNEINTSWLDRRIASKKHTIEQPPLPMAVAYGAMLIAHSRITEAFSAFNNAISRGQILQPSDLTETHQVELIYNNVKYSVTATRTSNIEYTVKLNGCSTRVEYRELRNGTLLLKYNERSHPCYVDEEAERYKIHIGRTQITFEKENDPTVLRSSCAGKLLTYEAEDGDILKPGQLFASMESMKVVLDMRTKKVGGRFKRVAQVGQVLHPGTLVARLEAQAGVEVTKPVDFEGTFEEWAHTSTTTSPINIHFSEIVQEVRNVFDGYCKAEPTFAQYADSLVASLFTVLSERSLPYEQMRQILAVLKSRIKATMLQKLHAFVDCKSGTLPQFPAKAIRNAVNASEYLEPMDPQRLSVERLNFAPILAICDKFANGEEGHTSLVLKELFGYYLQGEQYFQFLQYDKCVSNLLAEVKDTERCVRTIYSHTRINEKNLLAMKLLKRMSNNRRLILSQAAILEKMAGFMKSENIELAHMARALLIDAETPTYTEIKLRGSSPSPSNLEKYEILFETFNSSFDSVQKYVTICCGVPESSLMRLEDGHPNDVRFPIRVQKIAHGLGLPNDVVEEHSVDLRIVGDVLDITISLPEAAAKVVKPGSTLFVVSHSRTPKYTPDSEAKLAAMIKETMMGLRSDCMSQLVVMVAPSESYPLYFYYDMNTREELVSRRNVDFAHLPKLGLRRLEENYNVEKVRSPYSSGHLYRAQGKQDRTELRFFYRAVVRVVDSYTASEVTCSLKKALKRAAGEIAVGLYRSNTIDRNHVFLFIDRTPSSNKIQMSPADWRNVVYKAYRDCKEYLWRSRVNQVEVDFVLFGETRSYEQATKILITDDTGFTPCIRFLRAEATNGNSAPSRWVHVDAGMDGFEHGLEIMVEGNRNPDWNPFIDPYLGRSEIDKRRLKAHAAKTTYVYDYPLLFQRALIVEWTTAPSSTKRRERLLPQDLCEFRELVYDESSKKLLVREDAGSLSKIGMVAWRVRLIVPEYPEGREVIIIANDISHQIGSFSMREHNLYNAASKLSRDEGLPRIYIAANSGARIGLSSDLKRLFRVMWKKEGSPEQGFDGLYLTDDALTEVKDLVDVERVGEYNQLMGIIGKERDLGVENLVGSGLIAGETSRAYDDVVTYCLVTGRTVGIGAYVARLSRRICQVENADIILTGAPALNSLLGRPVYTSNGQLGGTQIMTRNGVSHSSVANDFDGVCQLLRWLSHTRKTTKAPFNQQKFVDPIDRPVCYVPSANKENDPRYMLTGHQDMTTLEYLDGLFDRNSFEEVKPGWGKTVITGRARLAGISVGVIAVETRSVVTEIPADPAAPDSQVKYIQQAGQVWYPDSAYKTAEAIVDFNKESLPLFILANWRGFSGGQKDMFEMVLKFGAYIVDELCRYAHPVFVYIPPFGELRGGAWAVVDKTINPMCMHMYADPRSRGSILEPEGTVQVKMRKDFVPLMYRLDAQMQQLAARQEAGEDVKEELEARIEFLMPTYRNICINFADLHDTPVRMKAVGAIEGVVRWEESRSFFARRLLRLCIERDIYRECGEVKSVEDIRKSHASMLDYFAKSRGEQFCWEQLDDEQAVAILTRERPNIVAHITHNELAIIGQRYGVPINKLNEFARKCDQLIREIRGQM
ncbi:Acetyl-CoA carboxylase [Toxocara canis]|uniref:Acetyl-CoA carboxylase n=1 Tax=Toxocara canis TaxID=6265 RepID=A0A0B2UZ26_TOXCA|nr:Acetyl-CoA carboxylase [Toxocara canis]